jgi:hypothetical protein
MTSKYNIAVLLPTRGRTDQLTRSVDSAINNAKNLDKIQFIFGFDNDDDVGLEHFANIIQPLLDSHDVAYEALGFESMGYAGLNQYYNVMAKHADADWLFVWNDDAVMNTSNWDQVISKYTGQFRLLKVHTHNEHPYSIFPIVPRAWFELMGHLSRHQMIDAELSQISYMLDVIEIIAVDVTHDQSELTGNKDDTSKRKIRFEGNPANSYDFHNKEVARTRAMDCELLSKYMGKQGFDTSWWTNVKSGKQYAWEKLVTNDINKQMTQFTVKINDQGQVVGVEQDQQANIIRQSHDKS